MASFIAAVIPGLFEEEHKHDFNELVRPLLGNHYLKCARCEMCLQVCADCGTSREHHQGGVFCAPNGGNGGPR